MELSEQIAELESDLKELVSLLEQSKRKRIQDVLSQEKQRIERELALRQDRKEKQEKDKAEDKGDPTLKGYTVKINNYGWDQSEKFVKVYITLKGVHKIPAENVQVNFTDRSFNVLVKDLDTKNYQMTVNNLLYPITVEESIKKVKTDMLLVMCRKTTTKKWEFFTQVEKQAKDKEKPSHDESADPGDGLMNILKKIYSDGDDEMKRTINKAWSESQDKKAKGDDFNF